MPNGKRILSVTIKHEVDIDPDTSYLGEYVARVKSDYTIDRRHHQECNLNLDVSASRGILERVKNHLDINRTSCAEHGYPDNPNCTDCNESVTGLLPMSFIQDQIDALEECNCGGAHIDRNSFEYFEPNWENYSGDTPENIRKYCWQDYERIEGLNNQQWYFLGIVAKAAIQATFDGHNYTDTLTASCWGFESDMAKAEFAEEESNQLSELKAQLSEYGFSKRAISKAMQNVKEN